MSILSFELDVVNTSSKAALMFLNSFLSIFYTVKRFFKSKKTFSPTLLQSITPKTPSDIKLLGERGGHIK